MQIDDEKIYLENLEEYVMDEGKIVTYKWLSANLDIHVNTAKQLLYKYAVPDSKRKDGVHLTYLLGGILRDGSGMKIQIVRESDLEKAKSQFKLITSEHIYSVQRADPLPDLNILYGVDNLKSDKSYEEKFGAIRYKNAVRRLVDDITSLKIKSRTENAVDNKCAGKPKDRKEQASANTDSTKEPRPNVEPVIGDKNPPAPSNAKTEPESSKSVETKTTGSTIAALFNAQTKAGKTAKPNPTVVNKPTTTKATKSGIETFFNKQNEKQNKPKPINSESSASMKHNVESKDEDRPSPNAGNLAQNADVPVANSKKRSSSVKGTCNDEMEVSNEESTVILSNKKDNMGKNHKAAASNQHSSRSKGGKKKKSEHTHPTKKRKRIMIISDDSASSGDDIFGNDSDTEMQPPSPEVLPESEPKSNSSDEDVIPSTPMLQRDIHNGRIRKRKLVDKTFEGKDGFLITKKEYVFESCSEDEGDKQLAMNQANETSISNHNEIPVKENDDVEKDRTSKKQTKAEKQPSKKKKPSPTIGQKTKQSTLMNFFSKS